MKPLETLRTTRMSWVPILKSVIPPILWQWIYRRLIVKDVPFSDRYRPFYSPWLAPDFAVRYDKIRPYTVVSIDRCWTIAQILSQSLNVDGDAMEAGVFQGGTARMISELMGARPVKHLRLFDSFEGMEKVSATADRHLKGDFADTSLEGVRALVGSEPHIDYRKGWVPATFAGLEQSRFCFAHIDLDLYQSVLDCLEFVYPRLSSGGGIVFDDYGFPSCPGARKAVDDFFGNKPENPLALQTGQAVVFKL